MLDKILLALALTLVSAAPVAGQSDTRYDVDPDSGLRMERYRAPVPADIPGGITLNTEQAIALWQQEKLIFIDVFPPKGLGPDPLDGHWLIPDERLSIPGAVWLPEVGRGTLTDEAVDYFKRNLVRLTNDKPDTSIAFYCTSDCWQSWNAAKRAIDWGYSAVHWLPVGTDGWLELGAELVAVQPINFFDDSTQQAAALTEAPESQTVTDITAEPAFPDAARIFLIDQQGVELEIGNVVFSKNGPDKSGISVEVDSDQFVDQFLSMRPFKCLTGASEWFCYLPYPYELKNEVTTKELTELEYQLLFIWKSVASFGIDAWNGVYYQLEWQPDGSLQGKLLQGDLNVLASPPEPNSHPIELDEFIAEDAQSRLYPSLIIRP
ncbi:rhodanese-like domain-containing protein [Granulosicoccus antarcticus]|uniref:Rhodanese domain-containing protein n=1 Tax=Granulosicoccus antarcticus IMCC3135 TaxID=1192854 RepID=A0A2Z2P1D8_9GAMM|nr:rhodanese-like domain-containing protein [Granulosicoccus antarcticus]ASJ74247.1 hypothetical protein IMCC3135_20850 [Granulosicoccus antarcticus IMCC3135]